MLTFTQLKNKYAEATQDESSANKTYGGELINEYTKRVVNKRAWDFTERLDTSKTTSDGTQFYSLPADYHKLIMNPYVVVGDDRYVPTEVVTRQFWDKINDSNIKSDFPDYFFIFNRQIGFWPTPAGSNTIGIPYRRIQRTMVFEDHTSGSITDATNGGNTIEGTGTSWNSSMAGKFIKIDAGNADPTGDGLWYEIDSVTNATTLELKYPYEGTTFTGGSVSYTIGEMPLLPDGFQLIPVYMAAEEYYMTHGTQGESDRYRRLHEDAMRDLEHVRMNKTGNIAIEQDTLDVDNPNLYIRTTDN